MNVKNPAWAQRRYHLAKKSETSLVGDASEPAGI